MNIRTKATIRSGLPIGTYVEVKVGNDTFIADINAKRPAWNLDPSKTYNTGEVWEYMSLAPYVEGDPMRRNRIIFRHEDILRVR